MYTDIVPELGYASRFYGRMLNRVRMYPGIRRTDDTVDPITEGLAVDLLDRIQDPGGGRSRIQNMYGRLMMITGEGNLFGRDLDTDNERWQFVWNDEVEVLENGRIKWSPTGNTASAQEYSASKAVVYRMWSPAPALSGNAESSFKSVLDIAEELVILTKGVRATAVSRLMQGILKIPSELSFGDAEGGMDEDPEVNIFLDDIIEHISATVENAGTAEAAAPFIAEGSYEYLDKLEWMRTHDPATDYLERELRKEAVQRLSYGLDLPAEVLTGLAEANHWTGRQIVRDMWDSHGAPVAEQMCDDFCEAYLRPALREAGDPQWQEIVIGYDDSQVVISPDRSEDADRAYDRGELSGKGYRSMKNIDEDLAPTEEERAIYIAIKMRNPDMLPEGLRPEPSRGPQAGPEDAPDAEEAPPTPSGGRDVSREEAARIIGAAELALNRCREVAGARLRSKQSANPDVFASVNGQPNSKIGHIIGPEGLEAVGAASPLVLCTGGGNQFEEMIVRWGATPAQASAITEMVTVFAARTLFDPSPTLPSSFGAQVERLLEVSHASASA